VIAVFNGDVPDPNFYYLSGIEEECHGVLLHGGSPVVLASPLEAEVARKYVETHEYSGRDDFWARFSELAEEPLGLNFMRLSVSTLEKLKSHGFTDFRDVGGELADKRSVKSGEELGKLKKAAEIASGSLEEFRDSIRPGRTGSELRAELEELALSRGAGGFAFPTRVLSGPETAVPHANTSGRRVRDGDVVLVDFGPSHRLYASDVTRTFRLGRDAGFRDAYVKVLEAQEAALDALGDGVEAKRVHGAAVGVLGEMVHSIGHGLGLEVHERPSFGEGTLRAGMVVAIEPGLYGGFGVRIEDVAAVGGGLLTSAPRDVEFAFI
jgi:Xaa-Pro aminopeptidase